MTHDGHDMADLPDLIAHRVRYFHQNDEAMFFAWLDRMTIVSHYEGQADGLHIRLAHHPNDDDLRELIAFHQRYGIDMRQLAVFQSASNAKWFCAPGMYWHRSVFG
jgi:hypothetical protein